MLGLDNSMGDWSLLDRQREEGLWRIGGNLDNQYGEKDGAVELSSKRTGGSRRVRKGVGTWYGIGGWSWTRQYR